MMEQTRSTLQKIKCYGMLDHLERRLHEATSQGWAHEEFLSALITDEQNDRNNRATKRRLRAAQFRQEGSLDKIDLTVKRSLSKMQVENLRRLPFLEQPQNVLILGPTGVGKTFLASALGNEACRQGYRCLFYGMNHLMEKTCLARAEGTFLKLRDRLIQTDLLILDDLGIKPLSPQMIQDLYDLLEERYQSKSTLITSQLPLTNWKEVIDDVVALEAIVDRLIHGCLKLELTGESYRKKRASLQSDKKPRT